MQKLPSLFIPEMVYDMTKDTIVRLAGENEDTIAERKRCTEKLAVLDAGLLDLKRFAKHTSLNSGEEPFSTLTLPLFYS
jgi:hypothetical protein